MIVDGQTIERLREEHPLTHSRLPIEDQTDMLLALRATRSSPGSEWRLSHPSRRIARVLRRHGIDVRLDPVDGTLAATSRRTP